MLFIEEDAASDYRLRRVLEPPISDPYREHRLLFNPLCNIFKIFLDLFLDLFLELASPVVARLSEEQSGQTDL